MFISFHCYTRDKSISKQCLYNWTFLSIGLETSITVYRETVDAFSYNALDSMRCFVIFVVYLTTYRDKRKFPILIIFP